MSSKANNPFTDKYIHKLLEDQANEKEEHLVSIIRALQLRVDGQQGLMVAYRTGGRVAEATFKKLERATKLLVRLGYEDGEGE